MIDETTQPTTATTQRFNGSFQPSPPPPRKRKIALAAIGGLFAAAIIAVGVIALHNSGSSKKQPSAAQVAAAYQAKLGGVLSPLVSANQSLSSSLQAIDGSSKAIHNAQNSVTNAQAALATAKGGMAVLTVPSSQQTLSQQAQQALTQENGYLQGVSSTLANPASQVSASVSSEATGTQTALVPLNSIVPGASASISGVENFMNWVDGANNMAKAASQKPPQVIIQNHTTTTVVPTPTPTPSSLPFTPGDDNPNDGNASQCDTSMLVGPDSDCSVAEQVSANYSSNSVSVYDDSFTDTVTDNANESDAANGATITFDCTYSSYWSCTSAGDSADWFDFQ